MAEKVENIKKNIAAGLWPCNVVYILVLSVLDVLIHNCYFYGDMVMEFLNYVPILCLSLIVAINVILSWDIMSIRVFTVVLCWRSSQF